MFLFLWIQILLFSHFSCIRTSEFVEIQQLCFPFFLVLLILHFVPRILFMSILQKLGIVILCVLSSSFHLGFFYIQGTFIMFKSEMIIIESVGWMPMNQLVV